MQFPAEAVQKAVQGTVRIPTPIRLAPTPGRPNYSPSTIRSMRAAGTSCWRWPKHWPKGRPSNDAISGCLHCLRLRIPTFSRVLDRTRRQHPRKRASTRMPKTSAEETEETEETSRRPSFLRVSSVGSWVLSAVFSLLWPCRSGPGATRERNQVHPPRTIEGGKGGGCAEKRGG